MKADETLGRTASIDGWSAGASGWIALAAFSVGRAAAAPNVTFGLVGWRARACSVVRKGWCDATSIVKRWSDPMTRFSIPTTLRPGSGCVIAAGVRPSAGAHAHSLPGAHPLGVPSLAGVVPAFNAVHEQSERRRLVVRCT